MCCFSGHVRDVSSTNIFARNIGDKQAIVYSMTFSAWSPVAMILPIPTPFKSADDSVEFVNLEGYPDFFEDMDAAFPKPVYRGGGAACASASPEPLKVHDVGVFEASFVPTKFDFKRLDERFRLPDTIWENLHQYRTYGFAVFKLKDGNNQKVHPMAFTFPKQKELGKTLFFPTMHIHDGQVTKQAVFDHSLYFQTDSPGIYDNMTTETAGRFMKKDTKGLVDTTSRAFNRTVYGHHDNNDILIGYKD